MTIDPNNPRLIFGAGNAKLDKSIITFSLPAGWSCPGAHLCLAKANKLTGKIQDGPDTLVRCFAATDETRPAVRKARWHNFDLLRAARTQEGMRELILRSIPRWAGAMRIHVSGDFFSTTYLLAWLEVIKSLPGCRFYAYSKEMLSVWNYLLSGGAWPENFQLVASYGGKHDHLIPDVEALLAEQLASLGKARIVRHPEEADALGLMIDHDDSLAIAGEEFALLIHGTQPKGSESAASMRRLKSEGVKFSYSKSKKASGLVAY